MPGCTLEYRMDWCMSACVSQRTYSIPVGWEALGHVKGCKEGMEKGRARPGHVWAPEEHWTFYASRWILLLTLADVELGLQLQGSTVPADDTDCGFISCGWGWFGEWFCFLFFFNGIHSSRTWGPTKTSVKCDAQQQGAFWLWSLRAHTMTAILESRWRAKCVMLLYICISTANTSGSVCACCFLPKLFCVHLQRTRSFQAFG